MSLEQSIQRPAAVRVAVLNQPVPVVRSRSEARRSCLRTADLVVGIAAGEPGLDLLVFPEYGLLGYRGPGREETDPGPAEELETLGRACRAAGVWVAASVTGGSASDRRHRTVLLDRLGTVVASHAGGPVDPRAEGSRIVAGPHGMRTALTFAGTGDPGVRGAELVVLLRCDPGARPDEVVTAARALAWTNACYVVSANAAGSDGTRRWAGFSSITGVGGELLELCEGDECELAVADLDPSRPRREREVRHRCGRAVSASLRRSRPVPHPLHTAPTC